MVNTQMDDATRQLITQTVTMAVQEAFMAALTMMKTQIDGLSILQETLVREMNNQGRNGAMVGGNQANRVQGYGRLTKLEFPKFSGDNVKDWLYRCNQFFQLDNVAANQKVPIASIRLYDKALDWHRHFERRNGVEVT